MAIPTALFIKGINGTDPILYDGKFHIALMGRSNVGKSTFINSLVNRQNLARSSSKPGKTIRMDFFLVNNSFYLVDFPGYGFAHRSQKDRDKLAKMVLWYLLYSDVSYRMVILIIDAKVGITDYDADMIKIFHEKQISYFIVANKMDNVDVSKKDTIIEQITSKANGSKVFPYSSKLHMFRDELWKEIFSSASKISAELSGSPVS